MKLNKFRKQKINIYISCEGKTEKTYFESLNYIYDNIYIKAKYNKKTSAVDVVNNFNTLFKNDDIDKKDLIFCAFDKDKNTQQQLNTALKLAKKRNLKILFSNPCFEIWLYWHFEASRGCKTSKQLKTYIKCLDGFSNYENDKQIAIKLKNRLKMAITVAQNAVIALNNEKIDQYSSNSNPSTNIHNLFVTCCLCDQKATVPEEC